MSRFSAEKTYALFANPANQKIIGELEITGSEAILFPAFETETALTTPEKEDILNNLSKFDWLIFPDIYTVEYFLQKLEEQNIDFFELDSLLVCAYGESVSDRLRYSQLHADIITNSVKTSDVIQALKDFIFDEDAFADLCFLVLEALNTQVDVVEELKKLKSNVLEFPVYQTKKPEELKLTKLKTLLKGGAIDEFIFTSPFDVINLSHLFQAENLADVLLETELFAADNVTLQSLQEFRLL